MELTRGERLQIMLTEDELAALDDWRFNRRMPSRAAAVRELLKRGLAAEGVVTRDGRSKSEDFGITERKATTSKGDGDGQSKGAGKTASGRS
jgi:hypothetical protein